jgi:hypothetical protein
MEQEAPVDDNKYTIGIAASVCLLSLPVIFLGTQPLVLALHAPWVPWLVARLFVFLPLLMAFITLYCGAWQHNWPGPKRILLSALLSCLIFGVDLLLLCYFATVGSLLSNCLISGG